MQEKLADLQKTLLEITSVIDKVCKDNDIPYSLYAGTLLGAIRHKGFIPWDDDFDICMLREDYDRFIEIWNKNPKAGYILQNKENTPNFSQSFTKIRKENTTFVSEFDLSRDYHTGIFVDIFPIDRMPNGKIARALFKWNCIKYQLFVREFIPPKGNIIEKVIATIFLKLVPANNRLEVRKRLLNKITKYNDNKQLDTVAIETVSTIKKALPSNLLAEFIELPVQDKTFMATKYWDNYLTIKYGDYMQLPPVEDRVWKHHPVYLEFDKSLSQILKENNNG